MTEKLTRLHAAVTTALEGRVVSLVEALGEVTVEVAAADYAAAALVLRDHPDLRFEQLTDLCGVDYSTYGDGDESGDDNESGASRRGGMRFAAVSHLLSVEKNWRLRLRVFAVENEFPVLDSLISVWPNADWYEREAFDLFGLMFNGHNDLRRILTDYGFIGHPFRKDFPLSGNVEMRYDPEQKRVIYQPVSIDPREITPRVIREEQYGELGGKH